MIRSLQSFLSDKRCNMHLLARRRHTDCCVKTPISRSRIEEIIQALLNLAAFKAKYQKRYPEAVRSLCEDEEHLLTFYAFPAVMHRYIRSTNASESFFSNVRQRTDQIDAFTTETSCLTIVWALMQDIRLPKIPVG